MGGGGGGEGRDFSGLSWLVVFEINGPLRQYFSLYLVVYQGKGKKEIR